MERTSIITLEMIRRDDVLKIEGEERFARAIYHGASPMYDWVDVVLDGGKNEEVLEFALLDGIDKWYLVHFVGKLKPEDIGLHRGQRLPNSITFDGEEYPLQSDGQATIRRVDRSEPDLSAHFADYVSGAKHLGVEIYDVQEAVYAGEAEVWYGTEIDFNSVELLPIDTDQPREGILTNTVYRPLPTGEPRHWRLRLHQKD